MIPLPIIDALDAVTIPIACPVAWDEMRGDERTRFCDQCGQNVHNVSELTRAEAVQLLTESAKAPCLRIYRREDGRVMTADCATKRERAWKWLHKRSKWAAALFALVFFAGCNQLLPTGKPCVTGEAPPDPAWEKSPERVTEQAARSIATGITSEAASRTEIATPR